MSDAAIIVGTMLVAYVLGVLFAYEVGGRP
jgi:hypothetical protein